MDIFDGSPRERYLLIGMAAAVAIAIVLLLLRGVGGGSPATADNDRDAALRELQLVETALASAGTADAPATERTPFDRTSIIRGAQGAGLTLSRVEPRGTSYAVTFDPAPSANVLRFLRTLERTTTGRIVELNLDATPDGLVDAEVTVDARP